MSVGKITRYGLPLNTVGANSPFTGNITPQRTLENYRLKLGGTNMTKALMTLFRIKADGHPIVEGSGAHLDMINAYRGESTAAGYLDIQFADYTMITELDRMIGAFDTSRGINAITIEGSIGAATAPTLTPILIESSTQKDSSGKDLPYAGLVSKILRYPFAIPNGGRLSFATPFGPQSGAIIKRAHFIHGGNMTGITVKHDSYTVHESLAAENQFDQTKAGRVPQANMYTVDFVLDGNVKKALDTRDAKSLEWLPDFSAADNGYCYIEYLDRLDNL